MDYSIIRGYEINNENRQKLYFYHVPKCAGLTVSIALAVSLGQFRIFGPWHRFHRSIENNVSFIEDTKRKAITGYKNHNINQHRYTAYDHYQMTENDQKQFRLVSGHVPFLKYQNYENRFTFTILRNPIERAISHYNFLLQKGYISRFDPINKLFEKKVLYPNLITSFFSSPLNPSVFMALRNLKKIDVVTDVKTINDLVSYLISIFNLPNVILTKKNETTFKTELTKEELSVFAQYNDLDLDLYEKSKHIWFDFDKIPKKNREMDYYSIHNSKLLIGGKKYAIIKSINLKQLLDSLQVA